MQTSTGTVEVVDSQSSPAPPIERLTIGTNTEDSNGLQEEFIWQLLSDQTTNSTLTQRPGQLPI